MKNYDYSVDQEKKLKEILKANNSSQCSCGRIIDFGDIAWNNASTEAGTPCCYVEIQCQVCEKEIKRIESWYPGIDDIDELLEVIEEDW